MKPKLLIKKITDFFNNITPVKLSGLILLVLFSIAAVHYCYYIPKEQMDLKSRIVGTRVLDTQHSPYFYRWQEGDDIRLFDPDPVKDLLRDSVVSRVTVTPVMLILHKPLIKFDYSVIKYFGFYFQILCFLLIFLFFYKRTKGYMHVLSKEISSKIIIVLLALGWLFSVPWDTHIFCGQLYIFYAAIITLSYFFTLTKNNFLIFLSGFSLGIFVFFRPTFIFMSIPFLLNKEYKTIFGGIAGLIFGFLFFVLPHNSLWISYFEAMSYWGQKTLIETTLISETPHTAPHLISSIQFLTFISSGIKLFSHHLIALNALFIISSLIFLRKIIFKLSIHQMFLLGAFFVITADFFLPAPRFSYYAVQWIFPLCLIITLLKQRINNIHVLIFFGLALNLYRLPQFFGYNNYFGEVLFIFAVLLYLKNQNSLGKARELGSKAND